MKVTYKHQAPEIVLKPNVYATFSYIAKNVKTNLLWLCLVRKLGNKYILEDVYFPPQNVNEYAMLNFSEEYVRALSQSTFITDYRACKFNMIGKFTMSKTTEITDTVYKDFEKLTSVLLDESLMMQLNSKMEISFAVSRKATLLTDIEYSVDMNDLIDEGLIKALLDSKIGKYSFVDYAKKDFSPKNMEQKQIGESKIDPVTRSSIVEDSVTWRDVV